MKRKLFLLMCILCFMLLLIGTAYADWFRTTLAAPPLFPEYIALIGLGATMVALGAYGRKTLTSQERHDRD